MQCSNEVVKFFYNFSTSFQLLFIFLFFSSIFLSKLFHFLCSYPLIQRNYNGYEYMFSDEEEEEEDEEEREYFHSEGIEKDHLAADIVRGGEALQFYHTHHHSEEVIKHHEYVEEEEGEEEEEEEYDTAEVSGKENSGTESEHEIPSEDTDEPVNNSHPNQAGPTSSITQDLHKSDLVDDDKPCHECENKNTEAKFSVDENYISFAPPKMEAYKKIQIQEKEDEDMFGNSCTAGSTSKSSSEWRSSINCSGTEDPFSSSSRRSCPKWESYTVFQKYDEEMMFLDRISAQKLRETESIKSFQVCPRSISERIVHKFVAANKRPLQSRHNPYHELEAAYAAQICLTWEALNWNYINFQRKRASKRDFDPGCPAHIAQQFQQFQVLLQRYIENEPYEQGRRPEVYARMRLLAPKLLQVPEYRDSEDDQKDDGFGSRISSPSFLMIMEDGIKVFMNFLKADKEKPCQIIASFFKKNRRGSVNPTLVHLLKKVNEKKKMKLKDIRRAGKCIRKRKLKVEEEMEILFSMIDLKVVSRVLRMREISEEQMHWCEEKMSKVRILQGKLQRDSSPLFFPSH